MVPYRGYPGMGPEGRASGGDLLKWMSWSSHWCPLWGFLAGDPWWGLQRSPGGVPMEEFPCSDSPAGVPWRGFSAGGSPGGDHQEDVLCGGYPGRFPSSSPNRSPGGGSPMGVDCRGCHGGDPCRGSPEWGPLDGGAWRFSPKWDPCVFSLRGGQLHAVPWGLYVEGDNLDLFPYKVCPGGFLRDLVERFPWAVPLESPVGVPLGV